MGIKEYAKTLGEDEIMCICPVRFGEGEPGTPLQGEAKQLVRAMRDIGYFLIDFGEAYGSVCEMWFGKSNVTTLPSELAEVD